MISWPVLLTSYVSMAMTSRLCKSTLQRPLHEAWGPPCFQHSARRLVARDNGSHRSHSAAILRSQIASTESRGGKPQPARLIEKLKLSDTHTTPNLPALQRDCIVFIFHKTCSVIKEPKTCSKNNYESKFSNKHQILNLESFRKYVVNKLVK